MLAQHSDDVLERMQVLRESQVALVSRNTRRLAGQQRGVALCKFSLENEVCALSIIGCPEVSGTKRSPGRSCPQEETLFAGLATPPPEESGNSEREVGARFVGAHACSEQALFVLPA